MRGKPSLPFLAAPCSRAALAQGIPCSSEKARSFPRAESCCVPAREDSACLGLSRGLLSLTGRAQVPMELHCPPKWATLPPKLCEPLPVLAESGAAAKPGSLVLSLRRVPSLSGRGARASGQEGQVNIGADQGAAAQTAPTSSEGSSSKQATPRPLLTAPKVGELGRAAALARDSGAATPGLAQGNGGLQGGLVRAQFTQALPRDTLTAGGKPEERMGWPWSLLLTWGHSLISLLLHPSAGATPRLLPCPLAALAGAWTEEMAFGCTEIAPF